MSHLPLLTKKIPGTLLKEKVSEYITFKEPRGLIVFNGFWDLQREVFIYRHVFIWNLDETYMDTPQSGMIFVISI